MKSGKIRYQEAASYRLDEIYLYSVKKYGEQQAKDYITGLFSKASGILNNQTLSRPIPAELGVSGFYFRYRHHFVYWRKLENGDIGIVTILHERMHQISRLQQEFIPSSQ